jgi:uncharacterized protein DUF1902
MMAARTIVVRVAYDPEAHIWYTESSDLFGLNAWSPSIEGFRDVLPGMIAHLIADNEPAWLGDAITVDLIASGRERFDISAAA